MGYIVLNSDVRSVCRSNLNRHVIVETTLEIARTARCYTPLVIGERSVQCCYARHRTQQQRFDAPVPQARVVT
jgi:acyl-[acyl carrier protein]--UDP-N-acetylglucosamine O-acyltransferase